MSSTASSTAQKSPKQQIPGAQQSIPKKASAVTPAAATTAVHDASLAKRMSVDKNIVDELLLVCGVIGTTVNETNELVPVTDCLNWLQDLQRALRRDDDLYRPVSLLLGQWKVVQQKLLPLVLHSRYDTPMVVTVCKILVILTKPLAENTVRAGRFVIDTKSKKTSESVIREQKKLRENALQQAETLLDYKSAICHHPSHLGPKKEEGGVLSVFVSLLAEPLSRTGNARTDADHLTIELVLHLFRNLLAADSLIGSKAENLHHELVALLDRELVLEILLVLAADIEQRENAQYNLLVMELLHHLLRHQDPTIVAKSMISKQPQDGKKGGKENTARKTHPASGSLLGKIQREKQAAMASATSRHSHFGGTLVVERAGGRKKFVSASLVGKQAATTTQTTAQRRKNKKSDPFIGASKVAVMGPAANRAAQTLHKFCLRFVDTCYGPVMKSLKNEFRRDSVRLEDGDRVIFFQIVHFFCKWWRAAGGTKLAKDHESNSSSSSSSSIGQLIFTMDVFTFNLVMNATDTFTEHKKYDRLAHSVALLSEMMHLLHIMYSSKESTEQIMAMGLMDRLFYGSEPLDRLPKLLSKWAPGASPREYLCDLVEVVHMTLKLLDANAKSCKTLTDANTKDDSVKHDTVVKMKAIASEFDVASYFARKIVSNQTVFMYTRLLSQYASNAPHVNHRIVAFFLRVCKHTISLGDDADATACDEDMPKNPLAAKTVTFEPMLYNVQMLSVLNTILNDMIIRKDKEYATLLKFAATVVHNFATATQANPMLFVEALFKHPLPHRFCESVTNMYVSDDLRMMAERDMLLQQQRRFEQESAALRNDDDESEDEELEFTDAPVTDSTKGAATAATDAPRRKTGSSKAEDSNDLEDSDTDDDDEDQVGNRLKEMAAKSEKQTRDLKKRLRELGDHSSSSDEDDIFGNGLSNDDDKTKKPEPKKGRFVLSDDSDIDADDDE